MNQTIRLILYLLNWWQRYLTAIPDIVMAAHKSASWILFDINLSLI